MNTFDSVGIILTQLRNGKWKAERIGVIDGRVQVLSTVTTDRQITWAHRCGADDFEDLVTDIARKKVVMKRPEGLGYELETDP